MLQPSCLENLNNCFSELKISNAEESNHDPLFEKIQEFECPFSWNFDLKVEFRPITTRIEDKLSEMVDEDTELVSWKLFVCNLVLCHEYGKEGNFEESLEKLEECELTLEKQKECSPTAPIMGIGLKHITLACRCHLLYMKNEKEEIDLILPQIIPLSAMTNKDAASVYCMKGAYCSEYGFGGFKKSLEFIEKGLAMDNQCPEWHFLLGRSLGRIRRVERKPGLPERRELEALENAAKLSDDAPFLVLLAQAYRETARNLFFEKKQNLSVIKPLLDTLNKKALDLIRKVICLNKSSPYLNIRCALGLIKLPNPWKDLDLAKDCVLKAIEVTPNNPMVNHVAGTYYSFAQDFKKALHYYAKAAANGVYGAEIDAIMLKKKMNPFYDPSADLLRCHKTYKESPRVISTLCLLGANYYGRRNVQKALEYWIQVIEIDSNSDKLQVHPDPRLCNIKLPTIEIILMELFKLMKNVNTSEEEKVKYQNVISKYREQSPETMEKVEKMLLSSTDEKFTQKKDEPHSVEYTRQKNRASGGWRRETSKDGCSLDKQTVANLNQTNQPSGGWRRETSKDGCSLNRQTVTNLSHKNQASGGWRREASKDGCSLDKQSVVNLNQTNQPSGGWRRETSKDGHSLNKQTVANLSQMNQPSGGWRRETSKDGCSLDKQITANSSQKNQASGGWHKGLPLDDHSLDKGHCQSRNKTTKK